MDLSLLQELTLLKEATDEVVKLSDAVKDAKPNLNKISAMLFGKKCEPVVDAKRSKKPIFFGVDNARSKLLDSKGKGIKLTFDNSTDSGEFEINSLTPLKIEQGGDLDKAIKALYKKHKVGSKKKTNYLDVDGTMVMREIHLGVSPTEHAVKLVRDAMKLIRGEKVEDEVEDEEEEPPKKEEVKESFENDKKFNHKDQWEAHAKSKGYEIEPDGSGKLIAHLDGEDMGVWDPKYGGSGFGWFHKVK